MSVCVCLFSLSLCVFYLSVCARFYRHFSGLTDDSEKQKSFNIGVHRIQRWSFFLLLFFVRVRSNVFAGTQFLSGRLLFVCPLDLLFLSAGLSPEKIVLPWTKRNCLAKLRNSNIENCGREQILRVSCIDSVVVVVFTISRALVRSRCVWSLSSTIY